MAYPLSRGMEPFVLRCGLSGSDGALTKIGACSRAVAPDRGDLQASEPLISLRKQSRKQRRPHPLTRFVRDEVLASATNREPRSLPDPGLPVVTLHGRLWGFPPGKHHLPR